jgi:dTDP-4-dehydrorhamnose reductase
VVDDVLMSPTYAADAADMVARMMHRGVRPGVYHVAGAGHCSWYAFAQAVFTHVGWSVNLMPITSSQLARPARRPSNSALVSRRLPSWGLALRPWQEGLQAYLTERGYPVTGGRG